LHSWDTCRLGRERRGAEHDQLKRWVAQKLGHASGWSEHSSLTEIARWAVRRERELRPPPSPRVPTHLESLVGRPNVFAMESAAITSCIRIEVGWILAELGSGPRASVYAFGDELVRLDCFTGGFAHMHLNLAQALRVRVGAARMMRIRRAQPDKRRMRLNTARTARASGPSGVGPCE